MAISKRDLSTLSSTQYDVLIVGGGISGAWLALHCAQSGYRTALIEKSDYASETSSSSSKLLHGGVRYLQQLQFGKVRESALERAQYVYAATHLTTAVPFLVPTYRNLLRSKIVLNCGMLLYRILCWGEDRILQSAELALPPSKSMSRAQLNAYCDLGDEPHTGGVMFYERHMVNSERMVLAILQTARGAGADVFNYVAADAYLQKEGCVTGAMASDQIGDDVFEIQAQVVVNAAGPWIDSLNRDLQEPAKAPGISGFAIGSHIITRKLSRHAIALTTRHQSDAKIDRGGRHVFVIPWRGHSLIGTSYDEVEELSAEVSIQADHVTQLLDAVNDGFPGAKLSHSDIVSGYSGLYPLRTDNIQSSVYQGSGEYQIIDHAQSDQIDGLITALGAKYTTGRKLSALTMPAIAAKLGRPCRVVATKLHNSAYQSWNEFRTVKHAQYASRLSADSIDLLLSHFGSQIDAFIELLGTDELLFEPIVSGQADILGQVVWAVEHEQAVHLYDVLFRRSSVGLLGITEAEVKRAASLMAAKCTWSAEHEAQQIDNVLKRLARTREAIQGNAV